jgi:hypothetical protein
VDEDAQIQIMAITKFDKAKARELAAQLQLSPLITGILLNRGLSTVEEIKAFYTVRPRFITNLC